MGARLTGTGELPRLLANAPGITPGAFLFAHLLTRGRGHFHPLTVRAGIIPRHSRFTHLHGYPWWGVNIDGRNGSRVAHSRRTIERAGALTPFTHARACIPACKVRAGTVPAHGCKVWARAHFHPWRSRCVLTCNGSPLGAHTPAYPFPRRSRLTHHAGGHNTSTRLTHHARARERRYTAH